MEVVWKLLDGWYASWPSWLMEELKPAREARGGDTQIRIAHSHVKRLGMSDNAKTKHRGLSMIMYPARSRIQNKRIWISVL